MSGQCHGQSSPFDSASQAPLAEVFTSRSLQDTMSALKDRRAILFNKPFPYTRLRRLLRPDSTSQDYAGGASRLFRHHDLTMDMVEELLPGGEVLFAIRNHLDREHYHITPPRVGIGFTFSNEGNTFIFSTRALPSGCGASLCWNFGSTGWSILEGRRTL